MPSCVKEAVPSCVKEAPPSYVEKDPLSYVKEAPTLYDKEAPPSCVKETPPSCVKETPPSCIKEAPLSCVKEAPPSFNKETPTLNVKEAQLLCVKEEESNTKETESSIHTSVDENFNSVIDEKIRHCYVLAQLKGSRAFLTVGTDKQLMILKVSSSQQIVTTDYFTLINVRHKDTKHSSGFKIIKAGAILKGKSFGINQHETEQKINESNIQLEGVGRNATELTDQELSTKNENETIEKMTLKVMWVGTKIFNNKQSIKVMTKEGHQMLISLDVPHHFKVQQDGVYIFTKTMKTNNWKSSSSFLDEVIMKFKTTPTSKIYPVEKPPLAFIEMGKEIGKVAWIDQKLTLFDQCVSCWKTRYNQTCNQSSCAKQGIKMDPNKKFITTFVIMDQEENDTTYKVWSDQLKDYRQPIPEDEDGLESVLIVDDLEKHFKDKLITFKIKRDNNENYEDEKFLIDVHLKMEQDVMDIE